MNQYYVNVVHSHIDYSMSETMMTVYKQYLHKDHVQSQQQTSNISRVNSQHITPLRIVNGTIKPNVKLHKVNIDVPATASLKKDHVGLQLL